MLQEAIFRHRQGALPLARLVEDCAGARNNGLGVDSSETFLAVWSYVAEARLGAAVASFKQQPTGERLLEMRQALTKGVKILKPGH